MVATSQENLNGRQEKKSERRWELLLPEWNNGMRAETTERMRRGAGKGEQTGKTWKRRREMVVGKTKEGEERAERKT